MQPQWHPLGFVSCVILRETDGSTVRVHYWPKSERRVKNPDWPVHTHTYQLSSLVLAGRLFDIQYQRSSGTSQVIYEVNYYDGGSSIARTSETISLSIEFEKERSVGEQYSVERGVFHETRVAFDESALTLVALSEFKENLHPLVVGSNKAESYPYDRTSFDREEFWSQVETSLISSH